MNQRDESGVYVPMTATVASHSPPGATPLVPPDDTAFTTPNDDIVVERTTADTPPVLELVVNDEESTLALDFESFYAEAYPRIARALAVTLGEHDLAQEATDEAMTRAYVHWAKVSRYENPGGWVYRVGLNWARSVRRRLRRALPWHERRSVDLPLVEPALHAALLRLDVDLRSVVVCRLLLDWSVEETASALEIKTGTVKSRLHRALVQLRTAVGDER